MQFIPPFDQIGVTPPGPWTNAAPQAGIQGSIVNADVFPAVQSEILAIIAADPNLTASAADLGQAQKSIAYQIVEAVKAIPAPVAPPAYGAAAEGGLAKDNNNNFFLALLTNLSADNRSAPVAADVLPLGRAADGAMVSVSAAELAAFITSTIASNTTENLFPNIVNVEGVPGVYSKVVWNNAYGVMEGYGVLQTNTGIPYYDYTLPVAFTTDAQYSVFYQDANSDSDPGPGVMMTGHAVSGGVVRIFPRVASTGEVFAGTLGFHFFCVGHQ